MSCESNDADCMRARAQVHEVVSGRVSEAEGSTIGRHCAECAPCGEVYTVETTVHKIVKDACSCDHAPEQLRARLFALLRRPFAGSAQ